MRIFPVYIILTGVFTGKDISRLKRVAAFDQVLTVEEKRAWFCIKEVIKDVLSGTTKPNSIYVDLMMQHFEKLNVHMSLKIHYLHCHIGDFQNQLSSETDEHGERFHQVAAVMEIRYKGKKLDALLGDLCWWIDKSFERDGPDAVDANISDMEDDNEEESSHRAEVMNIDASQNVPLDHNIRPRPILKRHRSIYEPMVDHEGDALIVDAPENMPASGNIGGDDDVRPRVVSKRRPTYY